MEHRLRNSRLSLTQAHLFCGCPLSFAGAQPVVSMDTPYWDHLSPALPPCFPLLHLMTLISCVCSYTSWFRHYEFSTLRPTQKIFSITYGSGSMMGFLAYDTFWVMCKEKLSQDWLWSDHCLQNRCRPSGRTLPTLTLIDTGHLNHRILSLERQCP